MLDTLLSIGLPSEHWHMWNVCRVYSGSGHDLGIAEAEANGSSVSVLFKFHDRLCDGRDFERAPD